MFSWLFLPLFAAAPVQADPHAVLETMRKAYSGLRSVHVIASQNEALAAGPVAWTIDSEYELAAKAGGKYRVRIKSGDQDSIAVSNGAKTWKALPRGKQWSEINAAGASEDAGDDGPAGSNMKTPDIHTLVQDMFIARYVAIARQAEQLEVLKEENFKLAKEKISCVVLRLRAGDGMHDLWVDQRGFVLQEVQASRQKINGIEASVRTTIKIKQLEIDNDVDDSIFAFEPERSWKEVEMLVLPGERSVLLTGLTAGDFHVKTLDGDQVQLSAFRGKVVVLDFWATWCPPCREELPHIEKLRTEFADKVQFFGIDDEDGATISSFQRKHNFELTVLMDQKRAVHRQYGIAAIPTVLIIGPDGVVRSHFIGGRSEETIRNAILAAAK